MTEEKVIKTMTDEEIDKDKCRWTPTVLDENERAARAAIARIEAEPAAYPAHIVEFARIVRERFHSA